MFRLSTSLALVAISCLVLQTFAASQRKGAAHDLHDGHYGDDNGLEDKKKASKDDDDDDDDDDDSYYGYYNRMEALKSFVASSKLTLKEHLNLRTRITEMERKLKSISKVPLWRTAEYDYHMPDEGGLHKWTWMAYGATKGAWDDNGGPYSASRLIARKDLMRIAANIARFEPVVMIVNDADDQAEAEGYWDEVKSEPVSTRSDFYEDGAIFTGGVQLPPINKDNINFVTRRLNDLWIRDTGAIFVTDNADGNLYGVNFHFNGWGQENTGAKGWKKDPEKAKNNITYQPIYYDKDIAAFTIKYAKAGTISANIVLEGGGVEVDGKGNAICTRSSILNDNRNPGKTQSDIEAELGRTLGILNVIWLNGSKAHDITDGHVDFYARFSEDGGIIYALDNYQQSPDYEPTHENEYVIQKTGRSAYKLETPDIDIVRSAVTNRNGWKRNSENFLDNTFAASYVGYYVGKNFLLMPQFGDTDSDLAAFTSLQSLFPDKTIMQITTDGIANGGGTIHCATQQQIEGNTV